MTDIIIEKSDHNIDQSNLLRGMIEVAIQSNYFTRGIISELIATYDPECDYDTYEEDDDKITEILLAAFADEINQHGYVITSMSFLYNFVNIVHNKLWDDAHDEENEFTSYNSYWQYVRCISEMKNAYDEAEEKFSNI